MLNKWKNNLRTNDGLIFRRLRRRLGSNRASVFLEFAFALPLLMTLSLFILEICLFWDTTIMANHAAFSLARIAKVNCYHGRNTDCDNPYPNVNIGGKTLPADQVVTAFYMMTSTFSWIDGKGAASDINFIDFFTINEHLFSVSIDPSANFFEQIIGSLIQKLVNFADKKTRGALNGLIKQEVGKIFSGNFGKQMNTRFAMALQRVQQADCIITTVDTIPGQSFLAFPSDNADNGSSSHPSGNYADPEVVKVSIRYPLHKGGWLYTIFSYWGKKDESGNTIQPVATGTYSMLVEPAKRDLYKYHANDDGKSDIDPAELRKEAKERVKKIAALVLKWEDQVKIRVAIEKKYGGMKQAQGHKDYDDAVTKELKLWGKTKSQIDKFNTFLKGGLCHGKSDSRTKHYPWWDLFHKHSYYKTKCDFTNCMSSEYKNANYCKKVVPPIRRTAGGNDLYWTSKSHAFPHYVNPYYANPYHVGYCKKYCD